MDKTEEFGIIEILRKIFRYDICENGDLESYGCKLDFTVDEFINIHHRSIICIPNQEDREYRKKISKTDENSISLVDRESHLDKDLIEWHTTASYSLTDSQLDKLMNILEIDENTPQYYEYAIPPDCYKVNIENVVNYLKKIQGTALWEEYIQLEENKRAEELERRRQNRKRYGLRY